MASIAGGARSAGAAETAIASPASETTIGIRPEFGIARLLVVNHYLGMARRVGIEYTRAVSQHGHMRNGSGGVGVREMVRVRALSKRGEIGIHYQSLPTGAGGHLNRETPG